MHRNRNIFNLIMRMTVYFERKINQTTTVEYQYVVLAKVEVVLSQSEQVP